jgi:hypothetical protein
MVLLSRVGPAHRRQSSVLSRGTSGHSHLPWSAGVMTTCSFWSEAKSCMSVHRPQPHEAVEARSTASRDCHTPVVSRADAGGVLVLDVLVAEAPTRSRNRNNRAGSPPSRAALSFRPPPPAPSPPGAGRPHPGRPARRRRPGRHPRRLVDVAGELPGAGRG